MNFTRVFVFNLCLLSCIGASAKEVRYDLFIDQKMVSPAGKSVIGYTINGTIPGPVLEFEEGDVAVIRVHNQLKNEDTSIHWHGLLLPNPQDGVPDVTTPSITPGSSHEFRFSLRHAGTYWYHSHTHLQEQLGVYGSIVVHPKRGKTKYREYVLQFSDWTNESPDAVMKSLMRGSEWPSIKKGTAQSIGGAWKAGVLGDYFDREKSRMMPMDVSDVAYDAFLTNGKPMERLLARGGETVKLRLINSGASTYFYMDWAGGPMTIVAADGIDVQPVKVNRLFVGMAETYDVLVTLPESGVYEFKATAQDGSGETTALIGEGVGKILAKTPPPPDLYSMDSMLDMALMDADEAVEMERPAAPYELLKSVRPSTIRSSKAPRKVTLHLTGDMERYQWSFNGKTMAEDSTIPVKKGEVIQFEFVNDTMMHHPLHLHGHFFRVLNRHGRYSPLKHTVDLPPMAKRVIEFEANEEGDWLFHCHLLYHMMAGMSRVVTYEGYQSNLPSSNHGHSDGKNFGEHAHDMWGFWGEASWMTHRYEGDMMWRKRHNDFKLFWDGDWEEWDELRAGFHYDRYLNEHLLIGGGIAYDGEKDTPAIAYAAVTYRLPYRIWSVLSVDSTGNARIELSKDWRLTPRWFLNTDFTYDTDTGLEASVGLEYYFREPLSFAVQYHSEDGLGAGVIWRF